MACEIKDPTNNPICSDSLKDLKNNAVIMDQYINSEEFEVPDRLGIPRKTWAGLEKDVQDAFVNLDPKIEQLIAEKIITQGGTELTSDYGLSELKAMSQKGFTEKSSRIRNSIFNDLSAFVNGESAVVNNEDVINRKLGFNPINGTLKNDGYSFVPFISENMYNNSPRFNSIGGQLQDLKYDLSNPYCQFLSINTIGDSNVWGSGTDQSATSEPRGGSISDARDHFQSNSWVNLLKRFIGDKYFDGVIGVLSNNASSPSGQSDISYSRYQTVFPYQSKKVSYSKGDSNSLPIAEERAGTETDWRIVLRYTSVYENQMFIEFDFTGREMDIYFTKHIQGAVLFVEIEGVIYEVDSKSSATSFKNKKTISFPFIKDKKVKIYAKNHSDTEVNATFYLEGIGINKTAIIKNNGIIGSSASSYLQNILDSAISQDDKYCFVCFGGNDRWNPSSRGARCISGFTNSLNNIIDKLRLSAISPIMISTSAGIDVADQLFNRNQSALASFSVAKENDIDFIDNYSVLNGTSFESYTRDGTHMNIYANAVVARNIVNSIESA